MVKVRAHRIYVFSPFYVTYLLAFLYALYIGKERVRGFLHSQDIYSLEPSVRIHLLLTIEEVTFYHQLSS